MTEVDPIINVRRQYDDWRIAAYRLSNIGDLHWDSVSGGVMRPANREYLHGYVFCDAMESGELAHSCSHGPPPHRIKICITKKHNEKVFPELLKLCPRT